MKADTKARALFALYGLPLAEFTHARQAAAQQLAKRGDKAASSIVAKARKPNVVAWVVNRLWRTSRGDIRELARAAKVVGKRADAEAMTAMRDALTALGEKAAAELTSDKHPVKDKTLQRVKATLQSIAVTGTFAPDAEGCLLSDRDPPGFDAMAGFVASRPSAHRANVAKRTAQADERRNRERAERERAAQREEAARALREASARLEEIDARIAALEKQRADAAREAKRASKLSRSLRG